MTLALAVLPSGQSLAQTKTLVDGGAGALDGYIVTSSGFLGAGAAGAAITGGTVTVENKIYSNFVTQGGDGSGGGAGLGGVFFVNQGGSLILNNVDFNTNTAMGGNGGSAPRTTIGTVSAGVLEATVGVDQIGAFNVIPSLTKTGSDYEVTSIQLSQANPLLKPGMRVLLPGMTAPAEITSISGSTINFAGPIAVDAGQVVSFGSGVSGSASSSVLNVSVDPQSGPQLDDFAVGAIVYGAGVQAGTTVQSINYDTGEITLSKPLQGAVTSVDFLNISAFDASQVASASNSEISLVQPNSSLRAGMAISGEGIAPGTTILSVSGNVVQLSQPLQDASKVLDFKAELIPAVVGGNTISFPNGTSRFDVGMAVSGDGIPSGSVIEEVGTDYIKLKKANGDPVALTAVPTNVVASPFTSVSGSTITVANSDFLDGIVNGMVITGQGIPAGTTVTGIDPGTKTITLSTSIGSLDLASVSFGSSTSTGGSMNGLSPTGSTGSTGGNGASSSGIYPVLNGGEGGDGMRGGAGGNGSGGAGGSGGTGGNGSDALPIHTELTATVALLTYTAFSTKAQITAANATFPPNVAMAAALTVDLGNTYVDLGINAAKLAAWNAALIAGTVAKGGEGGAGGAAGDGTDFFGGGAGGDGGNGGDSAVSAGTGGDGGDGGAGGDGGFGAGGGMGGAGGDAGSGKYAVDGTAGAGGYGGFGGGRGSDGDGRFGGGGSGFGGAIFVRNTGALEIRGNSTFSDNTVLGGSGGDRGVAGSQAGTDLFMMKGSDVAIRPGDGNTVTFNGSIADDSRASYAEASNAEGAGASITTGVGLTVFNGVNTYSGQTRIEGGTLKANLGQGIHTASTINFIGSGTAGDISEYNAGVLLTSGAFNRQVGTQPGRVMWQGSGGFAALGGELVVNLGGSSIPQTVEWNTGGFVTDGHALVFGSEYGDAGVLFKNNVKLGNGDRQIVVYDNIAIDAETGQDTILDYAEMSGVISGNGGLVIGDNNGAYYGLLTLSGANTYAGGTDIRSGSVWLEGDGTLGTGAVTIGANGMLGLLKETTLDDVTNAGGLFVGADLTTGAFTNAATGEVIMAADIDADGAFDNDGKVHVVATLEEGEETHTLTTTGLTGSGTFAVEPSVTLALSQSGTSIFDGVISGGGAFSLEAGTLTLTDVQTYLGKTTVASGASLRLGHHVDGSDTIDASIAASAGLVLDGNFDISGLAGDGTEIGYLTGADSGTVTLGAKTLTIAEATGIFAGSIGGTGNLVIAGGTQTLSGVSSYSGTTNIAAGATLAMKDGGSIATSSEVVADGTFDISQILVPSAYITTLSGSGAVVLDQVDDEDTTDDAKTLVITEAADTIFSGTISGDGGVTIEASAGAQSFTGINSYLGATIIDDGATLRLADDGSIAASSGVTANGTFDIAGVEHPDDAAWIKTLQGAGSVTLGGNTLVITAANGETFAGVISGAGGLALTGSGQQTLSGDNSYTGQTSVGGESTLALAALGDISESFGLLLDGTFDIAAITAASTAIRDLAGDGTIGLGGKRLNISDAASTFSGTVNGTGGFAITGGTQTLSAATLNTSLFVDSSDKLPNANAKAIVSGGSITANGGNAALNIVNGGDITTTNATVTADGAALASAVFDDEADKVANFTIGAGTTLAGDFGAANPGDSRTLLHVTRTGAGSNGIVNFVIDNDAEIVGDIIDTDAKTDTGGTNVTVKSNASWTGLANTASFVVETGASAFFNDGSIIDGSLTAEAGATILGDTLLNPLVVKGDGFVENGIITGNVYFLGDFTLNGFLTPGNSPGYANVLGNFSVGDAWDGVSAINTGASTLLEVTFGQANPQPAAPTGYDQINIGGDLVTGPLPITLAALNDDRSVDLTGLADIDLVRIGGSVGTGVVQLNRLTQHGHEIRLAAPRLETAGGAMVVGTDSLGDPDGLTEAEFFGAGDVSVYGLEAFLQDETYGLATLTGSTHQASDVMLGTFADRRGSGTYTDMEAGWLRFGANYTEVGDTVSNDQTVGFGQIGLDILRAGDLRAGVLASYGTAGSEVGTDLGAARLDGTTYAGGVHANWASGGSYVEAIGQYGYSDWTFSPVEAHGVLTAVGHTASASIEAGLGIGTDDARVTPWGQFLYQTTSYENVQSPWIDDVEFLNPTSMQLRGGVRAEGNFYGFAPYAGVAVAHDFAEYKAVAVDGYEFGTGMGGTRVEFGAGFAASVAESVKLTTDFKGAYGIGPGQVVGYQGQAGLRASW